MQSKMPRTIQYQFVFSVCVSLHQQTFKLLKTEVDEQVGREETGHMMWEKSCIFPQKGFLIDNLAVRMRERFAAFSPASQTL